MCVCVNGSYFVIPARFQMLVVCGKLMEGFDLNSVSVVGVCSRMRSMRLFTQFVGRAVRCGPGERGIEAAVVSDSHYQQSGNFSMLGVIPANEEEDEEEDLVG